MNDKQSVAIAAAKHVQSGMLVGLGTGSTANYFIAELARRQREDALKITTAASSLVTTLYAQSLQLSVVAMEQLSAIDLYVDGADEFSADKTLLKGRGSDLVKEKLLAKAAKTFIAVAESSKQVDYIGQKFPIPIEVLPGAWQLAKRSLEDLGGLGDLRQNVAKDGYWVSSHGSLVLDMRFDPMHDAAQLNALINNTPGVVEHGIFFGLCDALLIANNGTVSEHWA
ncbi:MAG: ribose-5-phosphate isomerase RpiA [Methylotenera sp.]|nr:ribose-5-phosphate isomerase RpiA [Methylotenera sp.]